MAFDPDAENLAEEGFVGIEVEHLGVAVGHIRQIDAGWQEDAGRRPHAYQDADIALARHLHAGGVDDIIEDENAYADDGGGAQTALADDGAEGRTDEEEEDAGEG